MWCSYLSCVSPSVAALCRLAAHWRVKPSRIIAVPGALYLPDACHLTGEWAATSQFSSSDTKLLVFDSGYWGSNNKHPIIPLSPTTCCFDSSSLFLFHSKRNTHSSSFFRKAENNLSGSRMQLGVIWNTRHLMTFDDPDLPRGPDGLRVGHTWYSSVHCCCSLEISSMF